MPAMRDLTRLPSPTAEALRGPRHSAPIRFSLDDAPERERLDIYSEFLRRSVASIDVEPLRDASLEVDVTLQSLPSLRLLSGRSHGSRSRRTRGLLADGNDDFALMVNLGGPYIVSQGDDELVLGDGDAAFVSFGNPCSFTHYPPGDVLALRLPRRRFAPLVTGLEDCCLRPIPRGSQALRLLTDYVQIARTEQTIASRELQQLFAAHVYDLTAVLIGATRDAAEVAQGRGLRAARLHAIKQDIASNLDRPDLSVAALAVRQCCTPRFVQRLFEEEGTTFTEYVLAQRLARAHRVLTDPRRAGEKISAVAYDCGFGDVSYFNRAFRRRYGAAPSDVRVQACRATPEHRGTKSSA